MIPDLPYFISLFLGEADEIDKPYKGRYFHAGGVLFVWETRN